MKAPEQGEELGSLLGDTFGEVESPPIVRFGLLRAVGNRRIRRQVHGASKCSDWVLTSMSDDSGFRSGSWAKYNVDPSKALVGRGINRSLAYVVA